MPLEPLLRCKCELAGCKVTWCDQLQQWVVRLLPGKHLSICAAQTRPVASLQLCYSRGQNANECERVRAFSTTSPTITVLLLLFPHVQLLTAGLKALRPQQCCWCQEVCCPGALVHPVAADCQLEGLCRTHSSGPLAAAVGLQGHAHPHVGSVNALADMIQCCWVVSPQSNSVV
jgi:hypothetical protein